MTRTFRFLFIIIPLLLCAGGCGNVSDQDLAYLRSDNDIVKRDAVQRIATPPSLVSGLLERVFAGANLAQAADIIEELLRSGKESYEIQVGLIKALGRLSQRTQIPSDVAVQHLAHQDTRIRETAAEALGRMKNPQTVSALLRALQEDKDLYVAIWALGEIGSSEAVPYLNNLLDGDERFVRFNAYKALVKIGKVQAESGRSNPGTTSNPGGFSGIGRVILERYQDAMKGVFNFIVAMRSSA